MHSLRDQGGYSLIELVLYVGIILFVGVLVVSSYFGIVQSYQRYQTIQEINNSANTVAQSIIRDIRRATAIDVANSVFNANPGRLQATTTENDGSLTRVDFYTDDDQLFIQKGAEQATPLTKASVQVQELVFNKVQAGVRTGVRMQLELSTQDRFFGTTTAEFTTTAIPRE